MHVKIVCTSRLYAYNTYMYNLLRDMNIQSLKSSSTQPRTSPVKFARSPWTDTPRGASSPRGIGGDPPTFPQMRAGDESPQTR